MVQLWPAKFANKTLRFLKTTQRPHPLLVFFFANPQILLKSCHNPFSFVTCTRVPLYVQFDQKICSNQKMSNIKCAQIFKIYNLLYEYIFLTKMLPQFIHINVHMQIVTIHTLNRLQIGKPKFLKIEMS